MEQVLVLLVLALVVYFVYRLLAKPDQNEDGKVDVADAVEVAKQTAAEMKEAAKKAADVNQDEKVNLADAAEVVKKVKKGRKNKAN